MAAAASASPAKGSEGKDAAKPLASVVARSLFRVLSAGKDGLGKEHAAALLEEPPVLSDDGASRAEDALAEAAAAAKAKKEFEAKVLTASSPAEVDLAKKGAKKAGRDERRAREEAKVRESAEQFSLDKLSPAFPRQPYYRQVAQRLAEWATEPRKCPVEPVLHPGFEKSLNLPLLEKFKGHTDAVADALAPALELTSPGRSEKGEGAAALEAKLDANVAELVSKVLGLRGVLTLLGIQCTYGSVDRVPPSLSTLIATFRKPFKIPPRGGLSQSVGARALTKHAHRSKDKWWGGEASGSTLAMNVAADAMLFRLLRDVHWLNFHALPHEVHVLEVRCSEGYGARWSADGLEFRGLLEPHDPEGHEKGWKH